MTHQRLFPKGVQLKIPRFQSEEICSIESMENLEQMSVKDYEQIVKICNEPLIYDTLFRERYKGKKYTMRAAKDFIKLASKSWHDGSWLVFFIRNEKQEIIAAVDMKSIENEQAEIGYWASENFSGIMTNAVEAVCHLAKNAGLDFLYALVRPENQKSMNVLLRLHFTLSSKRRINNKIYHIFSKNL